MTRVPTLAVTMGDPCGIGPEVLLKALARRVPARLIVVGDRAVIEQTAARLKRPRPAWPVTLGEELPALRQRPIVLVDVPACGGRFRPGRSGPEAGAASLAALDRAIALCKQGAAQGIVSGPVTKWAVERVRPGFVGQTEHLAERFGAPRVAMMFASDRLRVVVLTRHVALREVAARLRVEDLQQTIRLVAEALRRRFGIRSPRLVVCGLNPHAGEGGLFGDEEQRILEPAIAAARRVGIRIDGPVAADGFFAAALAPGAARYDAVLCPYHDQGLIPFKLLARDCGAQVTLGLPIVRTSPDHGTALDIAGRGIADPGAMRYAIELACRLAR